MRCGAACNAVAHSERKGALSQESDVGAMAISCATADVEREARGCAAMATRTRTTRKML